MTFPVTDQKLGAILQAFSDLTLVLDERGFIHECEFVNQNLREDLTGLLKEQKIFEILPEQSISAFERGLREVLQQRNVIPVAFSIAAENRNYEFDGRLVHLTPSQVLLIARDVTKCNQIEARLQQQLRQQAALRTIDLAIASGLDLKLLLTMVLDQATTLLRVDAVSILLLNAETNTLNFSSGKGFNTNILHHTRLKMGEGCAGRVALERRAIHIPDLKSNKMEFSRSPHFLSERFVSYYGVPLIAKNKTLGVLEIFHRSSIAPDTDWLDFLNLLAGQAAIAIDNAAMFKDIQRSNVELDMAYDATIEGWSRTLDLRDKEPEGHTRRVADMTVRLALSLGVQHRDLIHIRRGAILHDIGKVAIPDEILFKQEPLTVEEWELIHQHPGIGVKLLIPINYLIPALEIPHWHHEKWDGSGYPDHLVGEQIPLPARLFAMADVYDSLTSERPYRTAWSKRDAMYYIKSQSGKHFDPEIVPEFLRILQSTNQGLLN